MKKQKKPLIFFQSNITSVLTAILAAIAPLLFYACRVGFVFVDIVLFDGFCMCVFWAMVVNAIATTLLTAYKMNKSRLLSVLTYNLSIILFATGILFTALWIAILAVMGDQSAHVAGYMLRDSLPVAIPLYAAIFFALFFKYVNGKGVKALVGGLIIIVVAMGIISGIYPITKFDFTADPAIIDAGDGYTVLFATEDKSVGYVEYEYEGNDYLVYDCVGGRKVSSLMHGIKIPYEHLDGNSYRVGATRVIDELSYGGRQGKTVVSKSYCVKKIDGETQNWLCITDWHTKISLVESTAEKLGSYDGIIMLGDPAPGLQFEREAAVYIAKPAGDLSKGTYPIIYARGNHETRGAYAAQLKETLKLSEFYSDLTVGDYRFIVLDSGEDKSDTHPEYGGMNDFESYRRQMIDWLGTLEKQEGKKTIVIVHDYDICIENDLSEQAKYLLGELNASIIFSGHRHCLEYVEKDGEIPCLVCGGIYGTNGFIADMITLSGTDIHIKCIDEKGNTVKDFSVEYAQ